MGAQFAPEGAGWVVTCAEHDWRWHVETEGHALNLMRKHDREYEHTIDPSGQPSTLDLSAVARYLATCRSEMDDHGTTRTEGIYYAVLDVWEALTGLHADAALAYAEVCRSKPTTAVVPPF